MSGFVLDLWEDLREKGLWPVAVGLLLAAVTVPLLFGSAPSEEAAAPLPPVSNPITRNAAVQPAVVNEDSKLDAFDSKNPFEKPPGTGARTTGDAGTGPAGTTDPATGSEPAGGAGASPPSASGAVNGVSGSGGGETPTTAPDGGGGNSSPSNGTTKVETKFYAYAVDVRYGRPGHVRTYNGLRELDFLPNDRTAHLVFMGVTPSRKSAMFLVDTSLEQTGEGTCRPSRSTCSFLTMGLDEDRNTHRFTDEEGRHFDLKLLDIDRIPVDRSGEPSRHAQRTSRGGGEPSENPFGFPFHLLFDEIRR